MPSGCIPLLPSEIPGVLEGYAHACVDEGGGGGGLPNPSIDLPPLPIEQTVVVISFNSELDMTLPAPPPQQLQDPAAFDDYVKVIEK
jgi:hypothetical protein